LSFFQFAKGIQIGPISLEISALGKKRHRLDFARQLVAGSLIRSFEPNKDMASLCGERPSNKLIQFMDPSLPWWTKRDCWARWTTELPIGTEGPDSPPSLIQNNLNIVTLNTARSSLSGENLPPLSFRDALGKFLTDDPGASPLGHQKCTSV